ncbi:uncharacterized protein LOC111870662 isoform X3 [Cryptotermes secundus]|uniref:uncharacterized protein LOC111870662 isoform X3 n=1 Tax=Cryptotermes secundus TaxID=105785 RepID=UPI001454B8DD|nr:uncharacterized protein LOC111870662 isoform X3 [Cryptotermes secundus]
MAFLRRRDTMPPTPPLPITEDTPPDMLAGSMDLRVVLPTGHSVKMSVERSTPMMDLLVQVTTLNKISTGGHVLQAIGERGILPYKPSTPIGALDTWTIQVVPKSKVQTTAVQKKAPLKPLNQQQPFEPTFRLQVHLPRNQLYVTRVSSRTLLSDILHQTCTEKNLDPNKYELRHPANLSQLLSPSCTLADYGLQEVTLVARSRAPGMGSALSSSDIMALQREEDKRRQQARQQHGTGTGLGLVLNKQSQSSVCEGSVSSDSLGGRSISPARSDESASRSASPPAPSLPPMMAPLAPARPARKRRPAPKPPSSNNGPISNTQRTESNVQAETSSGTVMNGHSRSNNTKTTQVPVSHSRNSSDSSGYHEASVLSESPAEGNQMTENCAVDTLPREGKLVSGQPIQMKTHGGSHGLSRSMSSLNRVGNMAGCQHSTSNSSLASSTGQGLKKKKAPPPPPGAGGTKDHQQQKHLSSLSLSSTDQDNSEPHKKTTSLERHLSGKNSAAGSVQSPDKYSTLPGKMKMSEHDYRPVESPVKKPKIIPETKIQSPEEGCLDGDQKIPEVEEDVYVLDISKETPLFHSQMHQGEHDIATTNQSSDRHIVEKQDKCFEQLPMPPVETTPETPVELASKSNSPQVVNTGTPEASAALEHEPTLHTPAPKPRTHNKCSSLDDVISSTRKRPVPHPRQLSNSSVLQNTDIENHMQIAVAEERRERGSIGKKRNGENGSVGQTFGVGTTMLMFSQSGADSVSSDSWEWQSVRSQSSADVAQDSDDELNIGDNDMGMFDMATETSDTVQARNETRIDTSAVNQQLIDSCDDTESLSLVSSVFEYDSEHETYEASSTLKCPPLDRLMITKGEYGFSASKGGILHVVDMNELQENKVVSKISTGSSTSLQSMDEVPPFSNSMESLIMEPAASKQSWVLEYNSEPEEYSGMEPGDEVEEAFKSVTAELETAIKQDRDASALPPPPTSAASPDDLTVDWEYQLPAPPSAFRDSDSPTLTEGETVMLADTQVFRESPSSPEPQPDTHLAGSTTLKLQEALDLHLNSVVHRNEVTKTNPLFDPLQCEDDIGDNRMPDAVCEVGMEKLKNYSKNVSHMETKSQKQNLTEEELMKPKSLRDKSQVTSTMKGVPRSGENVNFTITTYQRPFSTDKLLNEDSDSNRTHSDNLSTDSLKEQTKTVSHHHKYSSTSSLNSSAASLSRTNSFNGNDNGTFTPPDPVSTSPVKRSTSYISLVTNPLSHPGNGFQSGSTNTLHTGKTKFVGNMAAQTQMDKGNERVYESWSLRKTTSECNVSQVPPEHHQEGTKSQTTVEEQKIAQVGQDKEQGSQKQIIITEEERAQLLALQEQFLQLQEQLLQNSGLMQQQQLSQPQVPTADTPLQSLQVLRSILPQLNKTKVLSDYQATSQQQKSDNSAFLRSETLPTELDPKDSEDFPNNESVKQTTDVSSNQQNIDEETSSNNNSGERKRYTYTGPPAINFATWSERPKSQVSIKMDCDYRIGIGQGGRTDERNKTPARTGMSESKDKISAVRSNNTDTLHEPKNDHEEVFAQNKMNGKLNSSQQVTEIEPASLTMRLISHTTASGFQKPVAAARKKTGSSSYIAGEAQQSYTPEAKDITQSSTAGLRVGGALQQNDPSRVPIVRAVELKKSFIQQQNMYINPYSFHSSSTMLNGDEGSGHHVVSMVNQRNSTAHHNGGSDADSAEETFAGVNFLAKRFSSAGSSPNGPPSFRSSRPLSSYGKVETVNTKGCDNATSSPYNTTLSYKSVSSTNLNASNVNTYQDAQLKNGDRKGIRRYTSVIGISNDIDHNLTLSSSQEPASESSRAQSRTSGPSVVRVNGFTAPKQLMPVVKGFQFASANANRDISAPLPAKNSNTTNASHTKVQRSESTSAIRSWKTVDTTDHSSSTNSSNTKTYLRRNSNESRPEQMVVKVTTKSAESEPPPPPPLAGSLQKSMARPRPRTLQAPQLSTRDQLMDAIRNFGGRGNLKQTGCS